MMLHLKRMSANKETNVSLYPFNERLSLNTFFCECRYTNELLAEADKLIGFTRMFAEFSLARMK